MDNPEDNYQFEFHAKAPTNNKDHFWFKVGDILELESVWNYAKDHDIEDCIEITRNAKRCFSHQTTYLIF